MLAIEGILFVMADSFEFVGYHLIANYSGCRKGSLVDIGSLRDALERAIVASGASVLCKNEHLFDNDGFSMVFLLSESHASIHTYPEHDSCFLDIFTCGTTCQPNEFGRVMEEYLKPETISKNILLRGQKM